METWDCTEIFFFKKKVVKKEESEKLNREKEADG